MKVLHIAHWYPHKKDPLNGSWIAAHIQALSAYCSRTTTYHVEVQGGMSWLFSCKRSDRGTWALVLHLPWRIARLNEWISTFLVGGVLLWESRRHYDLVNFHIAYPNALYMRGLLRLFRRKGAITEHWSAYHYGFHANRERLGRIVSIFYPQLPVLCVSNALYKDIVQFSQQTALDGYVVPNVVDTDVFSYVSDPGTKNPYFFAISRWKEPKKPLILLQAWQLLLKKYPHLKLRIGGMGAMWEEMQDFVKRASLEDKITFLGPLSPSETASQMQGARAFVHISDYETFSVVCAEALCCGTPVIASDKGALPALIDDQNGLLVSNNTPEAVMAAISSFLTSTESESESETTWVRKRISSKAAALYSRAAVGKKYYQILRKIVQIT